MSIGFISTKSVETHKMSSQGQMNQKMTGLSHTRSAHRCMVGPDGGCIQDIYQCQHRPWHIWSLNTTLAASSGYLALFCVSTSEVRMSVASDLKDQQHMIDMCWLTAFWRLIALQSYIFQITPSPSAIQMPHSTYTVYSVNRMQCGVNTYCSCPPSECTL